MLASFVLLTGVFLVFEGFSYLIVYNWDLEVVRLLLMLVLGIIVLSLSFTI